MGLLQTLGIKLFLKSVLPWKGDWKTKTGSIIIMLALILQNLPPMFPMQQELSKLLEALGIGLGGVGVADKLNKIGAKPQG